MILLIDNNDSSGARDYTAYLDADFLPRVTRELNCPAALVASLLSSDGEFVVPVQGSRVVLQCGTGVKLFTGYLDLQPAQQWAGLGQTTVWRYQLHAVDDSCLLDHNPLPSRTPFALRAAGSALKTLANDALPGGLDLSGVQDASTINQFPVDVRQNWAEHAQELATAARASYRAMDGKLLFQPIGQQSFTISEQDAKFVPTALTLLQPDTLHNDVTIIGELEPVAYVRDYFLGNGTTLAFYLSQKPYGGKPATVFQENYTAAQLEPTLWSVTDPNHTVSLSRGQLHLNGGPATISFVEQVELASGLMLQHGQLTFSNPSSGIVGGLYDGSISQANCLAGFNITPCGASSTIQAVVNGAATGTALNTTSGHLYALATQLICSEAHRVHQTYLSSIHPAGNGRGGDTISASVRVVLSVHDVDPNNPGTLAAPATVLFDGVLTAPPVLPPTHC